MEMNEDGKIINAPICWSDLCNDSLITKTHVDLLEMVIACNKKEVGPTERALVELLSAAGTDIESIQAKHFGNEIVFPMSSRRKRMSTIIENATGSGGYDRRILIKGAAEIVFNSCSHYIDESGERCEIKNEISRKVNSLVD